jgi:hypothetical protein
MDTRPLAGEASPPLLSVRLSLTVDFRAHLAFLRLERIHPIGTMPDRDAAA